MTYSNILIILFGGIALLSGCGPHTPPASSLVGRDYDTDAAAYVVAGEIKSIGLEWIKIVPHKYFKGSDLSDDAEIRHFKLGRDTPLLGGISYDDIRVGQSFVFFIALNRDTTDYHLLQVMTKEFYENRNLDFPRK